MADNLGMHYVTATEHSSKAWFPMDGYVHESRAMIILNQFMDEQNSFGRQLGHLCAVPSGESESRGQHCD